MEAPERRLTERSATQPRVACTLVWIDAREAFIARWKAGEVALERLESEVPAHHKSTGHVRHDPTVRHGGGGRDQTAGEPHRQEHLARFVEQVAERLPTEDDLTIIGPGTVREQLERAVREADQHQRRNRLVSVEASGRLSERQLLARARALAGDLPRRQTVGSHRWTGEQAGRASGAARGEPARVVEKAGRRLPPERVEVAEGLEAALAASDAAAGLGEVALVSDAAQDEDVR